jgi:hypothetical protein
MGNVELVSIVPVPEKPGDLGGSNEEISQTRIVNQVC